MAQIFSNAGNAVMRVVVYGGPFLLLSLLGVYLYSAVYSDWYSQQDFVSPQPVPFSHEHHVRGLGIDCRYCHTSVEVSAFAGLPPIKTCMTCHSQIWKDSPMLAEVRASWIKNQPIVWQRVYNLPDYVYFDHSIHVQKGVGCSTCHGQVDTMPLLRKATTLQMRWCLDCHYDPAKNLREPDLVYEMRWVPPTDQAEHGQTLVNQNHLRTQQLTNCSICHR